MRIAPRDFRLCANQRRVLIIALKDFLGERKFYLLRLRARKDADRDHVKLKIDQFETDIAYTEDLIKTLEESDQ